MPVERVTACESSRKAKGLFTYSHHKMQQTVFLHSRNNRFLKASTPTLDNGQFSWHQIKVDDVRSRLWDGKDTEANARLWRKERQTADVERSETVKYMFYLTCVKNTKNPLKFQNLLKTPRHRLSTSTQWCTDRYTGSVVCLYLRKEWPFSSPINFYNIKFNYIIKMDLFEVRGHGTRHIFDYFSKLNHLFCLIL